MTKKNWKPGICVDFDGVLHSYSSGWSARGATHIADAPVPGAIEWLLNAVGSGKAEIHIYSSRSKEEGGIEAMKAWLLMYVRDQYNASPGLGPYMAQNMGGPERDERWVIDQLSFPTQKPVAKVFIDDRAHCFMGRFRPLEWYLNFKPWNKRTEETNVPDYAEPGYAKDWNDDDEALADEALEVIGDCLITDKDGFVTFEPSAQAYMASMFMEARKNADVPTTRPAPAPAPDGIKRLLISSWRDIDFQYSGLTAAEQAQVTPEEFAALAKWARG